MPSDKPTIDIVADQGRSSSPWKLPARWRLEVRGTDDSKLRFKAAIARDGHLELIEEIAPYDREFSASRFPAGDPAEFSSIPTFPRIRQAVFEI